MVQAEECLWKVMNDQDCTDVVAKFLFPSFCLFSIQQDSLCQSFGNKLLQRFDVSTMKVLFFILFIGVYHKKLIDSSIQ